MPKNVRINIQLFVDFIGWCNNSEPSQLFVDKKHQLLNKLKNNSWDGAQICFTILQITGNDLHFLSVLILSKNLWLHLKNKNLKIFLKSLVFSWRNISGNQGKIAISV